MTTIAADLVAPRRYRERGGSVHPGLLDALLEVTRALSRPAGVEAMVGAVLGVVAKNVACERASLYLLDHAQQELVLHVEASVGPIGLRLPMGVGLAGWVAEHQVPVRTTEPTGDPRFLAAVDEATGFHTRSVLAVPLVDAAHRTVAVVQLLNKEGGFDAADEAFVSGLGPACAMAIANAELVDSLEARNRELAAAHARLRRQHAEQEALSALERALGAARDEAVVLQLALDFLVRRWSTTDASALLRGERNHVVTAVPEEDGTVRLRARRISKAWADSLLQRFDEPAEAGRAGVVQVSAPIVVDGARIGALQILVSSEPDPVGVSTVSQVAAAVGRAIHGLRDQALAARDDRLALVGQMMGSLLHDLRNPLSAISGYVAMLAEEDDPAERRDLAGRVDAALGWLETMSQEVLEFSRGTAQLALRTVAVDAFLRDLAAVCGPDLERFGTRFHVEGHGSGQVLVDPGKLRRVLANLARNAGEAGAKQVTVAVRASAEGVIFEVTDDGPGIHEEMRDRLFQAFATMGKPGGTGLGLAMALRVVEAHGGTIEALPGTPGAVFRITLAADPASGTPILG
jgi:signal transduction histidine kinase